MSAKLGGKISLGNALYFRPRAYTQPPLCSTNVGACLPWVRDGRRRIDTRPSSPVGASAIPVPPFGGALLRIATIVLARDRAALVPEMNWGRRSELGSGYFRPAAIAG